MLLVQDDYRRFVSVHPTQAAVPFVPITQYRTVESARDFLARFDRGDFWLRAALHEEITRGWMPSSSSADEARLIDLASWGIATGSIRLAVPIRRTWSVSFDGNFPRTGRIDVVGFANLSIAAGFVAAMRDKPQFAAALQNALRHEAGEHDVKTVGHGSRPGDLNKTQIGRLLANRWLMVLPVGFRNDTFRLVWRHIGSGGGMGADEANAPDPDLMPRRRRESAVSSNQSVQVFHQDHWVEIELLDQDDKPVANEKYSVALPNGKTRTGALDANGWARFVYRGKAGPCKVSFPELDTSEWKPHQQTPLGARDGDDVSDAGDDAS